MSNLYKDLAEVYEAMYYTFINYKDEYELYSEVVEQFNYKDVVEIGSGTGNLAKYFLENGFNYRGLDLSSDMIAIAKRKVPSAQFIEGNMCDFKLAKPTESIIITGRTVSYLLDNESINAAFSSFFKNLKQGGIVCFDFIDANKFIPDIAKGKEVVHEAVYQDKTFIRESFWELYLDQGMDVKWKATFYTKKGEELAKIGEDNSIFRTFTRDEMAIFLAINGFQVKEFRERASYAFPTYVVVAERKG